LESRIPTGGLLVKENEKEQLIKNLGGINEKVWEGGRNMRTGTSNKYAVKRRHTGRKKRFSPFLGDP